MNKDILSFPWFKFRIIEFYYNCSSEDYLEHYIEIGFKKEQELHKLRFEAPSLLEINEEFPHLTAGLIIDDISDRQLENLNLSVDTFENSSRTISFLAKNVSKVF